MLARRVWDWDDGTAFDQDGLLETEYTDPAVIGIAFTLLRVTGHLDEEGRERLVAALRRQQERFGDDVPDFMRMLADLALFPTMTERARLSKSASPVRRKEDAATRAAGTRADMAEEFVVLIVEQPWDPSKVSEERWMPSMHEHQGFAEAVAKAGASILGGDALQPPSTAVRITPTGNGSPVFTDGPFADTKEVVTGFYKLGVRDAAQARELAALCPTTGSVELWPVMDIDAG